LPNNVTPSINPPTYSPPPVPKKLMLETPPPVAPRRLFIDNTKNNETKNNETKNNETKNNETKMNETEYDDIKYDDTYDYENEEYEIIPGQDVYAYYEDGYLYCAQVVNFQQTEEGNIYGVIYKGYGYTVSYLTRDKILTEEDYQSEYNEDTNFLEQELQVQNPDDLIKDLEEAINSWRKSKILTNSNLE